MYLRGGTHTSILLILDSIEHIGIIKAYYVSGLIFRDTSILWSLKDPKRDRIKVVSFPELTGLVQT